jgi:hypothetical protein
MATLKSTTVADGTIELPDHSSAPSPTANKLYANTTSLYWEDGDLVSGGGGGAADKQTTGNAISNSSASDTGRLRVIECNPAPQPHSESQQKQIPSCMEPFTTN